MQANVNDGAFGALFVTVIIGAVFYLAFCYKKYGRADAKDNPEKIENREGREDIIRETEQYQGK